MVGWVALFIFTQLLIESYEKYSPGVFWDILIGRYIRPKVQKRIVLFLDLKDSTPIAEKLDSTVYFSFIRDFIYYISIALLEYDGRIYQYVGDEIVVSWLSKPKNVEKCVNALRMSETMIRKNRKYFLRKYGIVPEFKAGIHVGEVTVGEIGIIKKDLAISGDTMNTAARIRTACNELNFKCLASKDFVDGVAGKYIADSLGAIDLKGKTDSIELYSLKV
jgi:adenylate cyclase